MSIPAEDVVFSNRPMWTREGNIFADKTLFLVLRHDGNKVNLTEIIADMSKGGPPLGRTIGGVDVSEIETLRVPWKHDEGWTWVELAMLAKAFQRAKATGAPTRIGRTESTITIKQIGVTPSRE